MSYKQDQHKSLQILVKKVSDTVVICDLLSGKDSVEVMIKSSDHEKLVNNGFFNSTGHSSVYSVQSVPTTED